MHPLWLRGPVGDDVSAAPTLEALRDQHTRAKRAVHLAAADIRHRYDPQDLAEVGQP